MRTIAFLVTMATVFSLCWVNSGQAIEPVNPNWSGYHLTALEIPVPREVAK
jgi:hypothetical protein